MSRTEELVAAARLWAIDRQPYLAFALFALTPAEAYFLALEGRTLKGGSCGSCVDGLGDDAGQGGIGPEEAVLIRQRVAQDVLFRKRAGGHVPGGLARWAQDLLEPTVDWRTRLAVVVRTGLATTSGAVDYSYRRPSRRNGSPLGREVILPGMVQPVPRVGVIIDTSGSVADEDLVEGLSEVSGILRASGGRDEGLTVVACDTAVRAVGRVFDARRVALAGGGGTDLRAGFGFLAECRPRPQVVVALTDAVTAWPEGRHPFTWVVVALVGEAVGQAPDWALSVRIPPRLRPGVDPGALTEAGRRVR